MNDELMQALQAIFGQHVYPNVVPEAVKPPFAWYEENAEPVLTFDGIAGYDTTLTISVVAQTKAAAKALADHTIRVLHGNSFGAARLILSRSECVPYPAERLTAYDLIFNIL